MRNSWSQHLSLTYNQKYEYVLRVTWIGYEFFGTLALGIYLLKGDTLEERYLAIVILVLEGFPQFMLLGLTMIHWHSPIRSQALQLFREVLDKNILTFYQPLHDIFSLFLNRNLFLPGLLWTFLSPSGI